MPELGDIITKFNRSYIWTDLYDIKGLGAWRDINVPPEPTGVVGLFSLVPIQNNYQKDSETTELTFSIDVLSDINQTQKNYSYVAPLLRQLRRQSDYGSPLATLPVVQAAYPMASAQTNRAVVISFDIAELEYATIESAKKFTIKATPYNSSKTVNITASAPIIEVTSGNIVDLSFDITNLGYA